MPDITFAHPVEKHRYEIHAGGQLAGFAEYEVEPGALVFTHTEILPAFEGQGLASQLARHALDDARAQGRSVVPKCKFIAAFLRKHAEYQDLVQPQVRAAFGI